MDTSVVTVSVDATVAGKKLAVTGATISLGVNEIPSIELQCAPTGSATASELSPVVKKPTLSDYKNLYQTLSDKANGLTEDGTVNISVKENPGDTYRINLSGWKLSGVGLSDVKATSAPYMSVILQHPICELTKYGSICGTAKEDLSQKVDSATESCKNLVTIIEAVYETIASSDSSFEQEPNKFPSEFRGALSGVKPSKYLTCDRRQLFLADQLEGADKKIAQAIGRDVLGSTLSGGKTSTWDVIVNSSGRLLLSVVQDQNNNFETTALRLEPTQPWKSEGEITLKDEDCVSTTLPGMNPFRIAGVIADTFTPNLVSVDLGIGRNGSDKKKAVTYQVMYVPVERPDISDGRIVKVTAPTILTSAIFRSGQNGVKLTSSKSDIDPADQKNYNDALIKYCQAVYEISACSMVTSRVQMKLMFKDSSGKKILPGNTCKLISDGSVIYYGYIQNVVHHLSISDGCSTTLSLAYVRASDSFKLGSQTAIAYGSKNAAYK